MVVSRVTAPMPLIPVAVASGIAPLSSAVVMGLAAGARSAIEPRMRTRGFSRRPVPKPEIGSALARLSFEPLLPAGSCSS